MLRQGGWAVPLSCEHPAVKVWLQHVGALQKLWCWLAGLECSDSSSPEEKCTTFWTPISLAAVLGAFGILWITACGWLIRKAIRKWYTGTLRIEVAREAAQAARALQLKHAKEQEAVGLPHQWCKLARTSQHPVLCAVCFTEVSPDMGVKVLCCEVCGIAVHSFCRHLMPSSCRAIAHKSSPMLHHWLPAACVVENEYSTEDVDDGKTSLCIYCREPCVGMLLPVEEPIWSCSWCQQVCHVRCYTRQHAVLATSTPAKVTEQAAKTSKKKSMRRHPKSCINLADQDATMAGKDSRKQNRSTADGRGDAGVALTPLLTIPDDEPDSTEESSGSMRRFSLDSPTSAGKTGFGGAGTPINENEPHVTPCGTPFRKFSSQQNITADEPWRYNSGSADDALVTRITTKRVTMDVAGDSLLEAAQAAAPAPQGQPQHAAAGGGVSSVILPIDICRFGATARMVIPPACVIEEAAGDSSQSGNHSAIPPPPSPAEPASGLNSPMSARSVKDIQPFRTAKLDLSSGTGELAVSDEERSLSWTSRAMQAGKKAKRQAKEVLDSLEELYRGKMQTLTIHKPVYRIGSLSPWLRPLLVFINTKSGPQVGTKLRLWFLRMFNPLQVVELPREDPMQALRLFSGVTNLRILVVGGDGTVGWILNCIDHLQKEKEEETNQFLEVQEAAGIVLRPGEVPCPWSPPPIGVLPLGTGNDLARCLNWGGGMQSVRETGMTALVAEITRAAVVLLDRWSVTITPLKPKKAKKSSSKKVHAEPVHKLMNNYLGIGVDAKAALDFHNTREQYPQWFQSQLGNKMWYGVVGAPDVISHSCAKLPGIIRLDVDGAVVQLPDDIEGLMLLNITSYMGGVNLWTCGRAPGNENVQSFGSSSTYRHDGGLPTRQGTAQRQGNVQSMSDGMIEVVAVYGAWHLGQLQVGMTKAQRIAQGRRITLTMDGTLPMQIDGEPWLQGPAKMHVTCKGQAFMLRRLSSSKAAMMANIVGEALSTCESKGILNAAQRQAVIAEVATQLGGVF